jgi:hypothetical protein
MYQQIVICWRQCISRLLSVGGNVSADSWKDWGHRPLALRGAFILSEFQTQDLQNTYLRYLSCNSSHNLYYYEQYYCRIYGVSQNLCYKRFLGIPHPHLSKKVPINIGSNVNRFRDIDLRPCAGTRLSITQDVQSADHLPQHVRWDVASWISWRVPADLVGSWWHQM